MSAVTPRPARRRCRSVQGTVLHPRAAVRVGGPSAAYLLREDAGPGTVRVLGDDRVERFAGTDTRQVLGVPVLAGTPVWSVCSTEDVRRYGDHHLVVGRPPPCTWSGGRLAAVARPPSSVR
ncbi:hypothetical protein LV779_24530 [Streptomyces thinghirensis]|nr:hypothetical protein [Streptomyces thinghirensis]